MTSSIYVVGSGRSSRVASANSASKEIEDIQMWKSGVISESKSEVIAGRVLQPTPGLCLPRHSIRRLRHHGHHGSQVGLPSGLSPCPDNLNLSSPIECLIQTMEEKSVQWHPGLVSTRLKPSPVTGLHSSSNSENEGILVHICGWIPHFLPFYNISHSPRITPTVSSAVLPG